MKSTELKLHDYCLTSLSSEECLSLEGGRIPVKQLVKWSRWALEAAGAIDAAQEFWEGAKRGYNEVRNS